MLASKIAGKVSEITKHKTVMAVEFLINLLCLNFFSVVPTTWSGTLTSNETYSTTTILTATGDRDLTHYAKSELWDFKLLP